MTREQMKTEAIRRLKELKVYEPYIKAFEQHDRLTLFVNYGGFYIDPAYGMGQGMYDYLSQHIADIEKKYGLLVYAVTEEFTMGMKTFSCLCVSKYKEDWTYEFELNPEQFQAYATTYVLNQDVPEYSELGTITVSFFGGGLRRLG